jgi:hypothetical protein
MTTLYAVELHWKEGYQLRSIVAERETAKFYFLGQGAGRAFGYANRVGKNEFATSPRKAWERFRNHAEQEKASAEKRLAEAQADITAATDALSALAQGETK